MTTVMTRREAEEFLGRKYRCDEATAAAVVAMFVNARSQTVTELNAMEDAMRDELKKER